MFTASVFARRALCSARSSAAPRRLTIRARQIHVTAPVLKKKKNAVDVDNLFDDFEIVDESLPAPANASQTAETSARATTSSSTSGRTRSKLSPEERAQKFSQTVEFVKARIGRKPQEKDREARNTAWLAMFQLATSEADLRKVVELMPGWVPSGRSFTPKISEAFVRRCEELKCSKLALEVYGDYAKYSLPLTLPAARRLLHSVYKLSISDVMLASSLFGVYKLPPAAQDFVSCAFIVEACLRHNSKDSRVIADALLPHLRQLEKATTIDKDDTRNRENVWVQKSMESIEKHLKNPPAPKEKKAEIPLDTSSAPAEQTVSA